MTYKQTIAVGLSLAAVLLTAEILLSQQVLRYDNGQNIEGSVIQDSVAAPVQSSEMADREDRSEGEKKAAAASDNVDENRPESSPARESEQFPSEAEAVLSDHTERTIYLDYVDAWQKWHTMEVVPTVPKNTYDTKRFISDDSEPQWITYSDPAYTVLQGIDVYEGNGEIDWESVAYAGYSFAFVRVGYRGYGQEGRVHEDYRAIENLRGAKEAGLRVGAYFFSQALNEEEAREEAETALSVIDESGVLLDLPLVYDPELIKNADGRANSITREQVTLNTKAFRETVESNAEYTVAIYSNLPWEDLLFDAEILSDFDIWYADYEETPQTPYHFTWWQYSNAGTVPGIEESVDLDLWIIDSADTSLTE